MKTRDLALAGLEELINRYIALDPQGKARLAQLAGRTIAVELAHLGVVLFIAADRTGRCRLSLEHEGQPDCVIKGSPLDLLRSNDWQSSFNQLVKGDVRITGDTKLAQRFNALLSDLDVDWEEQLSRVTGDVIAHQTGRAVRATDNYLTNVTTTAGRNLNEYLTEEARLLPAPIEVRNWCNDVDTLRDDVERLAARVNRLKARTTGEEGE